jgi:hypothetical protein
MIRKKTYLKYLTKRKGLGVDGRPHDDSWRLLDRTGAFHIMIKLLKFIIFKHL